MNPARFLLLLALTAFCFSCARYRSADKLNGDRLLFLAYCFMIDGYISLIRGWFPC